MTIQKKLVYKCKGYLEGREHVFEYIDDNRKVDINTTGELICKIKKRLEIYSKSTNKDIKKYLFYWNKWLKFDLVPDGTDISFTSTTYQHFVKLNYQLLEPNKLLTHNQALFLLLGLNAYELGKSIKNFPNLDCDEEPSRLAEIEIWRTEQNQVLKTSTYLKDGKITSENLVILAEENNFFTKHADFLANRTIDEHTMKKLHKLLKDAGFITGKFDDLWQWNTDRNQLSCLAKRLKQKLILGNNCHAELANYIQDPSTAKRRLGVIKDPADTKTIDNIIIQLTA